MDNLSKAKQQALARDIRSIIEPSGVNLETFKFTFHELQEHIKKSTGILIKNFCQLCEILQSHYSQNTFTRLISHIKPAVVIDCSICHLSNDELKKIFYENDCENIITSLSFQEILNLANSEKVTYDVTNARFLAKAILEDTTSKYCKTVMLEEEKSTYVDTHLLDYCVATGYGLYTFDYSLGLRAKVRNINVKIFNNIEFSKGLQYIPKENGMPILLSEDLLCKIPIETVISYAKQIGAGKLLLTYQFIEQLEKMSKIQQVREYIYMFISNNFCIYINKEQSENLLSICNKYNPIILSSSAIKCFNYKCLGYNYKMLYSDSYITKNNSLQIENNKTLTTIGIIEKNESVTDIVTTDNDAKKKTAKVEIVEEDSPQKQSRNPSSVLNSVPMILPHFSIQKHSISFRNISLTEKIWILDSNDSEIFTVKGKHIPIYKDYTIIHAINHLNKKYSITAYKVKSNYKGIAIFCKNFSESEIKDLGKYAKFAERLILST